LVSQFSSVQKEEIQGDFGAPEAEVIPVRISPSVIHIYTSTMFKGLMHALAPRGDVTNRAHVVTISHGGLPSHNWADAVNQLYEAGVVVVAASGDSIYLVAADLATHFTVYPSAFNRVITALGVTYAKKPYITSDPGQMQGCWGPDDVMDKAIAAYTPNVAWMTFNDLPSGFNMGGAGTSSSTPQVAAACALWLEMNMVSLPEDWTRVEACRLALFDSADNLHPDKSELD
jgi:subtilase family protein